VASGSMAQVRVGELPGWRDVPGIVRVSAVRLPGRDAECFWVGAAVVLGQGLAEGAGPVGDGAVADLAPRDRQVGNGDREAPGMCLAHFLLLCRSYPGASALWLRVA
jgi:hypothetical protein